MKDDSVRKMKKFLFTILLAFAALTGQAQVVRLKDGKLDGTFSQRGFSTSLVLTKGVVEAKRPQCPQPLYPYTTEEVTFRNETDDATLAGTLTWPVSYDKTQKPIVVLMVSGSGQQNRSQNGIS